jgi:hypothetical protein
MRLLARFQDKLLRIWERHGTHPIGFWTTLVGESSNELTYILPWESLADREMRWTAFQNDPAWLHGGPRRQRARWTHRGEHQQPDPRANAILGAEINQRFRTGCTLKFTRFRMRCPLVALSRHQAPKHKSPLWNTKRTSAKVSARVRL